MANEEDEGDERVDQEGDQVVPCPLCLGSGLMGFKRATWVFRSTIKDVLGLSLVVFLSGLILGFWFGARR